MPNKEEHAYRGMRFTNRTNRWFCIIGVALLIAWNIFNPCYLYPRYISETKTETETYFDYLAIIVAAFSIIVMLLVGWQILINFGIKKDVEKRTEALKTDTTINIDKAIEKLKQDIKDNESLLKQRIKDEVALAKAEALAVISLSAFDNNQLDVSISVFYKSIDCCFDCSVRDDNFLEALYLAKDVLKLLKTKEIQLFSEKQLKIFKKYAEKSGDYDVIAYTEKLIAFNKSKKEEKGEPK